MDKYVKKEESIIIQTENDLKATCNDTFFNIYKKAPLGVAFCPYRICPIGAHSDHQLGKITGMAINEGVRIAYGAKQNGVVELSSLQFEKRAQWHVSSVPEAKQNDWADYLRGATLALGERFALRVGLFLQLKRL